MLNKEYDFVGLDWLKRIIDIKNWPHFQDFYPWELLSSRSSTRKQLLKNYDEYYDSFIDDADEHSLARTLQKIEVSFLYFNIPSKIKLKNMIFNTVLIFFLPVKIQIYFIISTNCFLGILIY